MQICSDAAARARRRAEFGGISDHVRHRLVRRPDQRVLPRIAGDQLEVRRLSPVPTDLAAAFASFRAGGAEAINVGMAPISRQAPRPGEFFYSIKKEGTPASFRLKTATIVAIPNNNKLLRTRIAGGWFVGPEGQ